MEDLSFFSPQKKKIVSCKPNTVITYTEDTHKSETEYKITGKTQLSSPVKAWLTFGGFPHMGLTASGQQIPGQNSRGKVRGEHVQVSS